MTTEREKAINEWLEIYCPKCANNDDRGTNFLNCQAECEVQKDIGIACIHYEKAYDIEQQESEDKLDGNPVDIDKAVEHYEGTLEALKDIDLEVDG